MRMALRLMLLLALLVGAGLATPAARSQSTSATPGPCETDEFLTGAQWMICIPTEGWNDDLVIWAHGYVAADQPLDFSFLKLPDGSDVSEVVQGQGYAFATTTYRTNGLAVLTGMEDIRELVAAFPAEAGQAPRRTYLMGFSEGGLITTLLIERHPELFSGGLAACGPIGDFQKQTDYIGDFRVLFDYFFPDILPSSPISVPHTLIDNWSTYVPTITNALATNPISATQLISTTQAAVDPAAPATVVSTTLNVLWYNVFGANDAAAKLGGSPYNNLDPRRVYSGSSDDARLNAHVQRFATDPAALAQIDLHQTSGALTRPLVTLHTTGDEIVPFWHQTLYGEKVPTVSRGWLKQFSVNRYGHCNFSSLEIFIAFGALVQKVNSVSYGYLPLVLR